MVKEFILHRTLVCACVFASLCGTAAVAAEVELTLSYPIIKRPLSSSELQERIADRGDKLSEETIVRAAGGEYELAVIGVHVLSAETGAGAGAGEDDASGMAGGAAAGGAKESGVTELEELVVDMRSIPVGFTVSLYYLPPFEVTKKTRWFDGPGARGQWFDPCVPLSFEEGELTGVFDLSSVAPLGSGTSRYFLLEIRAPRSEYSPDDFPLRLYLRTAENRVRPVPRLRIVPFRFDLPQEHSLPFLSKLKGEDVFEQHRLHGLLPEEERGLWLDYLELLREHRIVPYNPDPEGGFDAETFEAISLPLYRGELIAGAAPAPAIRFPTNRNERGSAERRSFFRNVAERLKEEGLLDRAFYYVDDEPLMDDYTRLIEDAKEIRSSVPRLRTLVTEPYTHRLEGLVDIWCIDIPMYDPALPVFPLYGKGSGLQPEFQVSHGVHNYDREREKGRELWMYSCTSAQVMDYPSLFIDTVPAGRRIIPWILHHYRATGMIYFRLTHAYRNGNDPWENQYYFGANGDGTLLYPAHPDLPWFGEHGAVASLRMKLLRDGLEDYEYLLLASGERGGSVSSGGKKDPAGELVDSPLSWEKDLSRIAELREDIGMEIEEPGSSVEQEEMDYNQLSQPSVTLDYWFIPKWASPSNESSELLVPSYRHLLASVLDTGHRSSNIASRGRWQVYLQAGPLLGLFDASIDYGGYSAVGWTVSLETAGRLERNWLVPYMGIETGIVTGSHDSKAFTGFAGSVLAGMHLWTTERASLAVGGAWTHSTTSAVPMAFRGTFAFDFVLD